jgi:hypothetical protein
MDQYRDPNTKKIVFDYQVLNNLTQIPNAGDLYRYITFYPSYPNSTHKTNELNIEMFWKRSGDDRSKSVRLLIPHFWTYDYAHERIPILINPIMDSIMKGQIEKQEEV